MAFESTAIHNLVAGLQSKPVPRDSDWLFGEQRGDATEIDTRRDVPALTPSAFGSPSEPMFDYALIRPPTAPERTINWTGIAKKLALPIAMLSLAIVAFGVYSAKAEEQAASLPMAATVEAAAPVPAVESASAVESVPAPVAVPAAALAPVTAPDPVRAPAPVPAAAPQAVAAVAAVPAEAAPAAEPAAPVEQPAPEEKLNIEPGSPASRFLPDTSAAPVIPTVTSKPVAAPAPTAVLGLAQPAARQKRASEELGATIVAAAPAKKTAMAKRVAKAPRFAPKARAQKKVAVADDEDDTADDAPARKPVTAKPTGTGVLAISSTPAMEVWVDGRNSKAMTPVRIKLRAGKRRVSLLDNQRGKARSFDIVIKPDETTTVTKSY